jgi:DNA-binding ferritin-like protein
MSDELELKPRHRTIAEIAPDLAKSDAALENIKARLKAVTSGYKAQIEDAEESLDRYREEYAKAMAATGQPLSYPVDDEG